MSRRSKKGRAQERRTPRASDEREPKSEPKSSDSSATQADNGGDENNDDTADDSPGRSPGVHDTAQEGSNGPAPQDEDGTDALSIEDQGGLRRSWARHDLWVIVAALALIVSGGLAHRRASIPQTREFRLRGLSFSRPEGFLPPTPVAAQPSALASALGEPNVTPDPQTHGDADPASLGALLGSDDVDEPPAKPAEAYHVVYQGPTDPLLRLEVRIDSRPTYNNLVGALSIYRTGRYGGSYWASDSRIHNVAGRDWTRTEFRYTYKASETDSPKVATAIEYATLNEDLLYVVTFHGTPEQALELAEMVAASLRVRATIPAGDSTP